jgi:hypothetical protein
MEQKFPLLNVRALSRTGSDHTPLLLEFGSPVHGGKSSHFSFELSWLKQEGFMDMVTNEWRSVTNGPTPIESWKKKIRHLRKFLRGWARNVSGEYKKEKERLLNIIDSLDIKAEISRLSECERKEKKEADERLAFLRRNEESKWAQRAKVKYIQEGGDRTKYFHLIANGKHRKKKTFQLEQDEGTIIGEENLKVFISEYYKGLFGAPNINHFTLMEDRIEDIPQLSSEEKELLSTDFTELEVMEAIMEMKKNKASGPDGFPAEFYQVF